MLAVLVSLDNCLSLPVLAIKTLIYQLHKLASEPVSANFNCVDDPDLIEYF